MSLREIYKRAGYNAQLRDSDSEGENDNQHNEDPFDHDDSFSPPPPGCPSCPTLRATEAALQLLKEPIHPAHSRSPARAMSPERAIFTARHIIASATPSPERRPPSRPRRPWGIVLTCRALFPGRRRSSHAGERRDKNGDAGEGHCEISTALMIALAVAVVLWLARNHTRLLDAGCLAVMRIALGTAYMVVMETVGCGLEPTVGRALSNCLVVLMASLLGGCVDVLTLR